jgi:hypothetical protein
MPYEPREPLRGTLGFATFVGIEVEDPQSQYITLDEQDV